MKRLLLAIVICFSQLNIPAHAAKPDEEYKVGVDDILEISILQPEKLSQTVTVSQDGSISFPYINSVRVEGATLNQIQNEIQTRLSEGYMKYPLVTVLLKESRSRKFFVYGDVTKPGVYLTEGNTSVLKAISIAGGFIKSGSSTQVKVLRPKKGSSGQETIEIDIKEVMRGLSNADILLQAGDTVIVSQGKFYVYGEVNRPGVYPMEDDTTVLKAISISGGFTKYGASNLVKILRLKKKGEGQETVDVDIKDAMRGSNNADILLQPGDTVIVSQSKFYVYGEVNHPGAYPMEDDTTVLKAISIAGGFTKFGSSNRVKLLRPKENSAGYETTKVNIKEIMDGSSEADILLKQGDTVVVLEGII